jgi:hypothetical protein
MSFTNPQKKKSRGVISGQQGSPSFYTIIKYLPVQKGMNMVGEVRQ